MNAPASPAGGAEAWTPAAPRVVKACCADLWAHPGVRLLAGEALRPGGLGLTERGLARARLSPGDRVLDVGCGPGSTLGLLRRRGLRAVGVDLSPALAAEAAGAAPAAVADAERLPFRSGSFRGVLMECVLSAVPDKAAALAEAARVLRPGGALVLSDVTRSGPLPEPLRSLAGWVACAAGALPARAYAEALAAAGLAAEEPEDHGPALAALVDQARRRLALLQGAMHAGLVGDEPVLGTPGLLDLGQHLLGLAAGAVARGELGYVLLVARR